MNKVGINPLTDYGFTVGGGLSPVVSTFSVVVLVALSGVVSIFCLTVVLLPPPGVVTVVSVFLSVVAFDSQPMVAAPKMQATGKIKKVFMANSPVNQIGGERAKPPLHNDIPTLQLICLTLPISSEFSENRLDCR